jgi:hypothetical protein
MFLDEITNNYDWTELRMSKVSNLLTFPLSSYFGSFDPRCLLECSSYYH